MRAVPITLLLMLMAGSALAQPVQVTRILRNFDFEERKLGNVEDLPMDWVKVEGAGLPHYVSGHLSTERHRSGDYSFQFDLNGGGLIYRYPSGFIPVRQGAHYSIRGYVQTTPLPNARARITAYLTDPDGHAINSTVQHSELFDTPPGDQTWHALSVEITDDKPEAGFLVIELELLQPAQYANTSLGARALFSQDIRGSAWFDDVTVSQVPEVLMTTDRPGNIFRKSDAIRLSVLVSDLFTDDLAAQLFVQDAAGRVVFQNTQGMELATAQSTSPGHKCIPIDLPASLGTGWYRAKLVISSRGQFVCRQSLNFVHLADDNPPGVPDERFGMSATDLDPAGWAQLPDVLPTMGAGRVKLSVWSKNDDLQQAGLDDFDQLLVRLNEAGVVPTACLSDIPPSIKSKLNGGTWSSLLTANRQLWQPQLAYVVARHADHLQRWQVGPDGSDMFVQQPEMRKVFSVLYDEFSKLMYKPDLAMPWPAWYELDPSAPSSIALYIKPDILPAQLPLYISDMKPTDEDKGFLGSALPTTTQPTISPGQVQNLSLYLESLDRAKYGREVQIADLVERIAYALSAGADRIDLQMPMTVQRMSGQVMSQPDELLMIERTLMTTLAGAKYCGKVPLATGIEAFLFNKDEQGIILLWDRAITAGRLRNLALNLGPHPHCIDMWGNVTPLVRPTMQESSASDGDGKSGGVLVQVGSMPIFLVDVDVYLAQMRASVAIDDPKIESSFEPHHRHIRFTNPYRQSISGMVRLRPPAGWTLDPPTFSYSLNPGETLDRDLTIEFPYNSFAGNKLIMADISVQAEKNNRFSVPIVLKLGLSDVGLQTIALRDGHDVVLQQMITNYGEKPINYTAYAIFPGQARQERLITNLAPGATTVKKYRFANASFTDGARARSGMKETDGVRVLNSEVEVR